VIESLKSIHCPKSTSHSHTATPTSTVTITPSNPTQDISAPTSPRTSVSIHISRPSRKFHQGVPKVAVCRPYSVVKVYLNQVPSVCRPCSVRQGERSPPFRPSFYNSYCMALCYHTSDRYDMRCLALALYTALVASSSDFFLFRTPVRFKDAPNIVHHVSFFCVVCQFIDVRHPLYKPFISSL
jgi:hypothetical protein